MKIFSEEANEFLLTKTRIGQLDDETGKVYRFVKFSDLKKYLPKNGSTTPLDRSTTGLEEFPRILHYTSREDQYCRNETWLTVRISGELSIGCQDFDAEATRAIYKAAGIRRKVTG